MFDPHEEGCMAHSTKPAIDSYCAGIQQLLDEHEPLRCQMTEIVETGNQLAGLANAEWNSEIEKLKQAELAFKHELEIHSDKEEQGLFPLLGAHIGTQFGPIAVMEYEHNEAKRLLALFEEQASNGETELTKEQAVLVVNPLVQACQVLFDHFMKEENVLFPMAENVLNEQEKEQLLQIVWA